jgi:2-polyprenyl-3-methyl-5-hydroxy-6-metoxy-1,4-benzoquinol methylase
VNLSERYDDLIRSPVLESDPAGRADLISARARHLLILELVAKHLSGPRVAIADLGPGNGALLRLARELGFTRLIAVDQAQWDPSRSFLAELDGVEFVQANFNEDAFLRRMGDAEVDVVISTEVLEHVLNHPWGYLCECWRVVRDGGLLALTTPNPCTAANALRLVLGKPILWDDEWFAKTPKVRGGEVAAYPFVHYREYPPSVFKELLSALPGASIVRSGFVANRGLPSGSVKSLALAAVRRLRLDHVRLVSHTQYAVLRKGR